MLYQNKSEEDLVKDIENTKKFFGVNSEASHCSKQVYLDQLKKMKDDIISELNFFAKITNKNKFNQSKKISKITKNIGWVVVETSIFGVVNYLHNKKDYVDLMIRNYTRSTSDEDNLKVGVFLRFIFSTISFVIISTSKKIYDYFNDEKVDHFTLIYSKLTNFCEIINRERQQFEKNIGVHLDLPIEKPKNNIYLDLVNKKTN